MAKYLNIYANNVEFVISKIKGLHRISCINL
jgi:hypothetical protein